MGYILEIRPDALSDIEDAMGWYEQQQPGQGADFACQVLLAIDGLAANPLVHRVRDSRRNVRWFLPRRFPYRIVYRVNDEVVTIAAVLHAARHDRHWRRRANQP